MIWTDCCYYLTASDRGSLERDEEAEAIVLHQASPNGRVEQG